MARKDALVSLRKVLEKRRDAMRKALAGDFSALNALRETSGDVVDVALDSAQNELNSQLAEVENRELAQIEIALEKMQEGSFGLCEICDKSIPLARLQALPYATNCIDCQTKKEMYGEDWGMDENSEVLQ
ncbi:MAG: TraR/DksA family transcriptional regulator [Planctomycetota bacterium]|nr:TraR/DksA family transcriptional regulator [Planctomycetota bacterium]